MTVDADLARVRVRVRVGVGVRVRVRVRVRGRARVRVRVRVGVGARVRVRVAAPRLALGAGRGEALPLQQRLEGRVLHLRRTGRTTAQLEVRAATQRGVRGPQRGMNTGHEHRERREACRHRVVERQQQQRGEQRGARHAQSDLRCCVLPLGRAAAAAPAARGALLLAELLREEREEVSGRW